MPRSHRKLYEDILRAISEKDHPKQVKHTF